MKIKPGADLRFYIKVGQLCFPEDVPKFISLSKSALRFHLEHVDCVFVITSFVIVDSEKCFEEC